MNIDRAPMSYTQTFDWGTFNGKTVQEIHEMGRANYLFWLIDNNYLMLEKEAIDYILIQWFKDKSYKAYMDSDFRKSFMEIAEKNRHKLEKYYKEHPK